ncbi:NAD(+) diphosphatase [uncultured Bifidobacterium sp.]|uniref:NAD(+) diphosphatase n=1 Tax=uncultured Bifidobacterium sp. TaxID=165187 RepID=UPI00262E560C|nr:NAD(+) diphosphatase [uncultured Bifidobacterium sp.]
MTVVSPVALTLPLTFLPLAQGDVDYQVDKRSDPHLVESVLADPRTMVVVVSAGRLAVPKGQRNLAYMSSARMRLASIPGSYAASSLAYESGITWIYLGSYHHGSERRMVVAADVRGTDDCVSAASESIIDRMRAGFEWVDLRLFAPHASAHQAGIATTISSLSIWHDRQRFCPICGSPVDAFLAGWAQRCRGNGRHVLFPRVEPAVITLIVDARGRILLQHNAAWDDDRLYSVSAGFVEAGENLEHACRREASEETGVTLGDVRYLGSQPWPYPASLMTAFTSQAVGTDIHVDGDETLRAEWLTRDDYTMRLASGGMIPPGKATIARYMIEQWYGRELD